MEQYLKIKIIGEGTFGVVHKATHIPTGKLVAIKDVRKQPDEDCIPPDALTEISILNKLSHNNIVQLIDVIQHNKNLYLVFECMALELKKYLNMLNGCESMDPGLVRSYLFQLTDAILHCHQRSIVHLDIKPQNLLIDINGTIKVADFGSAQSISTSTILTEKVVTLWYRCPELLMESPRCEYAIDIWSLGCVFAEMVRLKPLFKGDCEFDQLFRIFNIMSTPNEEKWPGISCLPGYSRNFPTWSEDRLANYVEGLDDLGLQLLRKMLIYDPAKRISANDIKEDQYFSNVDLTLKPLIPTEHESI